MTIDLRNEHGREVVLKLSEQMDVVVSNFRAGILERWGLGYEEFHARNTRIIYALASGVGRNGPNAGRPMRSEENTSELQSLMRISYAIFCLTKKHTTSRT